MNGADERQTSYGGNFTKEDPSTCYNTFFSYQINFSQKMVTHISLTLMSRLYVNIGDTTSNQYPLVMVPYEVRTLITWKLYTDTLTPLM